MTERSADAVLEPEAREWLIAWARRSIEAWMDGVPPQPDARPIGVDAHLGCFVTVHTASGELRGCIGTFAETQPLWLNVQEMAVAAASRDPRFEPMRSDELASCVLEISVLTPRRAATPDDVEVGKHGVCIEQGHRRGVLLPQVATDNGWDRDAFLDYTCLKAGLPPTAWRDDSVSLEVFTADVFSESH